MEVSKFKIGSDIIDIKDAQARDDVVAAMNAAQDAQSTADMKLNADDAWKIGTVSATRSNATITAGTYATIQSPTVSASNVIPLFAYCPDVTQLTCIRLSTDSGKISAVMDNIGSSTISGDITITIVYAYK